jgi:hypothetical protein
MPRRTAAPGILLFVSSALLGACADVSPTGPAAEAAAGPELFRTTAPDPAAFGGGLDAVFVRIAGEVPGFGGFFYDDAGTLNIVQAPAAERLSLGELQSRLAPHLRSIGQDAAAARNAVVRQGEYDFIQLHAMHRRVSPLLGLGGVVFTDADEVANRVRIGVEDAAAAAAVARHLAMTGVPREAVIITETAPIRTEQTVRDRVRPVGGGLQIWRQGFSIGTGCTHGFNVGAPDRPGVHGFVTNSHCTLSRGTVNGTAFFNHRPDVPETHIGDEVHDLAPFTGGICPAGRVCRHSDTSGQRYAPGVDNLLGAIYRTLFAGTGLNPGSLEIDPANPRWRIVDEIPFPVVGQVLHKTGRTNGWTSGPVNATCQTTNVGGSNYTMICQDRVTTWSAGGDSGSPYFVRIGETSDIALIGIHWGSDGAGNTVMSAMQNTRFENQGPVGWITYPGQTPPPPPPAR